jgi:hypothetical protein
MCQITRDTRYNSDSPVAKGYEARHGGKTCPLPRAQKLACLAGKQLILYSSTALSQSLPCLFLDRGLSTPPPSLPYSPHSPFPGRSSQIFGNPFPTAWDISLSIVGADIMFARPRPPLAEVSELALAAEASSWCKAGKRIPASLQTMDPGDAGDQWSLVTCGS